MKNVEEQKKEVTIIPSTEIYSIGLSSLVGKKAVVTKKSYKKDGRLLGAWVKLAEPIRGYDEWFIPEQSLSNI